MHPIDVASQGIDLAVVAHEPQRLGAIPAWKCVGGKAGVNHRKMGFEVVCGKVRVVRDDLCGSEHPLVDQRLGRERTDVKQRRLLKGRVIAKSMAGLLANHIKLALELFA